MVKFQKGFICCIGVFSAVYLYFSLQMKSGSLRNPGPGFVPAILGTAGIFIAVILLVTDYLKTKKTTTEKTVKTEEEIKKNREATLRVLGHMIAVVLFVPLFYYLGSLMAIFLLVFALTKISGTKGYVFPIIFSALTSGITFLVFDTLLRVPLPKGIFFK